MSRILGVDHGRVRLGLAISDEEGEVALPLMTISMQKPLVALEQIRRIVGEKDVKEIVVGLPLSLSMQDTEETQRARIFAKTLGEKLRLPVHLENEIFSTKLFETARSRRRGPTAGRRGRKGQEKMTVDALAAADILQRYLDRHKDTSAGIPTHE